MLISGPAPDAFTNKIFDFTKSIKEYLTVPDLKVDLDKLGVQKFTVDGALFEVEIIDSVQDYLALMKQLFDFQQIKNLIAGKAPHKKPFVVTFDSLHGVTGPYVRKIFCEELGAPMENACNAVPLPDFGGEHPDPNLTYAHKLVERMQKGTFDFGAAFDGDGVIAKKQIIIKNE